jgi:hypothetical protein
VSPDPNQVFAVIANILAYTAAITTTSIALIYRIFFAYEKTPAGRVFSQFLLALAAVFILATLFRAFGEYPFRQQLATIIFGWWALTTLRMLVEMIRSWRHGEPRIFDLTPKTRRKNTDTGPINTIQKEQ